VTAALLQSLSKPAAGRVVFADYHPNASAIYSRSTSTSRLKQPQQLLRNSSSSAAAMAANVFHPQHTQGHV
jgi:hypothetical protein